MDAATHYSTNLLGKTSRFARKTRHDYVNIDSIYKFLHGLTFKGLAFFWVFLCKLMVTVFGPIVKKISSFCRFEANKNKISISDDRIGSNNFCVFESNKNSEKKGKNLIDKISKFENMEDFHDCCSDDCSEDKETTAGSSVSSKYEFSSGIHLSGFIEEPNILSLIVHEGLGNQHEAEEAHVRRLNAEKVKQKHERDISERKLEEFIQNLVIETVLERKLEADVVSDQKAEESVTEKVLEELDRKIDSDDEFIELELQSQKFSASDEKISSRDVSSQVPDKQQLENFDDSEHEDIIEIFKMEIKNSRKGGLQTISEDSDSPLKVLPELKPLEIDQKFDHKDRIVEITKMYKGYSEKMKKLDVLNLQTIHATGFTQQKIFVRSTSTHKSAVPAVISTLVQGICKPKRPEAIEPMKCSPGLKNDFEMVYVGQLCLSWEILHWQYKKALEFRECDDRNGFHHYNQVAGEFQLFQVLVQRFLENEPFQSQPRIENYVRSRSVLRSLLQVPVIIDDASRDKKQKNGEEHSISIATLTDMIGESMRLLWEFIHADAITTIKGPHQTSGNLQNPADLELVMEIRNNLHKKEKKMKEIVRNGSCIVKMFQKHEEYGTTLLFAQVELKLIARVLSMSRITRDHLVWCREKLHRINFCKRKIDIEPSFILFPC